MEHLKKLNLLNKASDYKFVTRNWNIANYQSNGNSSVGQKQYLLRKCENVIFVITTILTSLRGLQEEI